MSENPVYLYLMGCEGIRVHSKIGIAKCPELRCATLQCGNPNLVWLHSKWRLNSRADAEARERTLHLVFEEFRALGEWFALHPDTIHPFAVLILSEIACQTKREDFVQHWQADLRHSVMGLV
jgi:hypothetical protein